jgi:peptidoglycan/LPS O-acetylase OafA/YrhL
MAGAVTQVSKAEKGTRTIPSLDGMRALSIGIVILSHAQGTRGFPTWIPAVLVDHGTLGVHIFFVISGFLITALLMEELERTGRLSLGLFYARRTLRIFPPCYLFIAFLALMSWLGFFAIPARNFFFAATYTVNYLTSGLWVTGHLWSLSVEEQFYLVWPLTLKLAGMRRALWIAGILTIASPLICLSIYLVNPEIAGRIRTFFPLIADSIAAGCVLAGVVPWLRRQRFYSWLSVPAGDLIVPLILLLDLGRSHPRIHFAVTETALNICICYAVVRYTEFPKSLTGRLLNFPPLAYIGKLSYSLYLWQQIFMNRFETGLLCTFPVNVAASFGCALMSYYFLELPMAGMRRRLHPAPLVSNSSGSLTRGLC